MSSRTRRILRHGRKSRWTAQRFPIPQTPAPGTPSKAFWNKNKTVFRNGPRASPRLGALIWASELALPWPTVSLQLFCNQTEKERFQWTESYVDPGMKGAGPMMRNANAVADWPMKARKVSIYWRINMVKYSKRAYAVWEHLSRHKRCMGYSIERAKHIRWTSSCNLFLRFNTLFNEEIAEFNRNE